MQKKQAGATRYSLVCPGKVCLMCTKAKAAVEETEEVGGRGHSERGATLLTNQTLLNGRRRARHLWKRRRKWATQGAEKEDLPDSSH